MIGMDSTGWDEDGVTPHPTGGYVRVYRTTDVVIYLDTSVRKHRFDGPAVEWTNGTREWWINGLLNRLEGSAIECPDGTREWLVNGKRHRIDGPAVELADGTREWWVGGKHHRLDGPAVERPDGAREWWLGGVQVTEAEHAEIVARLRETGEAPDT